MKNRKLSVIDVWSIALGSIIGWGAFMLPGSMFLNTSGVINTTIGILLGGIAIIFIENSYEKMLIVHKDDGGEYSYTLKEFGEGHGFICGWMLVLTYICIIPLNATAFPLVLDKLLNGALKFGYMYTIGGYDIFVGHVVVSLVILLLFTVINLKGLKESAKVQTFIAIGLAVVVCIITAKFIFGVDATAFKANYISNYQFSIAEILTIFSIAPWAFVGFDAIPQISQDIDFPAKRASKIAVVSVLFSMFIYIALTVITGYEFNPGQAFAEDWAAGAAVLNNLGYGFFLLLVFGLSFAVFGGINGFFIASSKLVTSMSNHNVLPKLFAKLNKNSQPKWTILFISIVSIIAPWFGRTALNWVVNLSSVGAAVAYFYVCLIRFKKASELKGKVLGGIGAAISVAFMLLLILPFSPSMLPIQSFIALAVWIALGIFYYVKYKRRIGKKLT